MNKPKDWLIDGTQSVDRVLGPAGFAFHFREEGKASGGPFAWGEFVRGDRRLELHFRYSLGLVTYHVARHSVSHELYMRELGVWQQCRYPDFPNDPLSSFDSLAHDLSFADDFVSGSAEVLLKAAKVEADEAKQRSAQEMARSVGDIRLLEQMGEDFRNGRYADVVNFAAKLKYPDQLSVSQQRMIEIARTKATNNR
jgi:hypothetical protein